MRTGRKPLLFLYVIYFRPDNRHSTRQWVYIPYKQMIAEADVVLIGGFINRYFRVSISI